MILKIRKPQAQLPSGFSEKTCGVSPQMKASCLLPGVVGHLQAAPASILDTQ